MPAPGPEGLLLQVKNGKVTTATELGDNLSIFSLLIDSQGRLLIGTGGEKGQIFRIDRADAKPQPVFSSDGVQYIWSMLEAADGTLYAATGPNGQLFQINPDGSNKVLYDSEENNLLSMVSDGKDMLFVGTDPNGLVFRIDRKTGQGVRTLRRGRNGSERAGDRREGKRLRRHRAIDRIRNRRADRGAVRAAGDRSRKRRPFPSRPRSRRRRPRRMFPSPRRASLFPFRNRRSPRHRRNA
jgi:hypothetical protein